MSLIISSIIEDIKLDARETIRDVALPTFVEELLRYFFVKDESPLHYFSDDVEIEHPDLDLLGRTSFAKSLSETISAWNGRDSSLVIGLYGPWGAGKSSVKKLLLHYLNRKSSRPLVVQFNPWEYSVQERIAFAFFEAIGLGLGSKARSFHQLKLARDLAYYASRIKIYSAPMPGPGLFRLIEVCIFSIGLSIGVSSETVRSAVSSWLSNANIGVNYSNVATLLALGLIAIIASIFVGYFAQWLSSVASSKLLSATHKGKTTWEIKRDLRLTSSKLKRSVLLIIDDIDRLSAKETRELFQLVKSNSDLPNFIYLLLFDRDVVENALVSEREVISGQQYLEKIVQVGFDVPAISKDQLFLIIERRMSELVEKYSHHGFVPYRLENVFKDFLSAYFDDVRDIKRFFSSFQFILEQYENDGSIEVNLIDLAILEVIRIREPKIYKQLFPNKRVLLNDFYKISDEESKKYREFVDSLSADSTLTDVNVASKAIAYLFPKSKSYQTNYYLSKTDRDIFSERRICSKDFFDHYFMFSLTDGAVLTADIRRIFSNLDVGSDGFVKHMRNLNSMLEIRKTFSRMELYFQDITFKRYFNLLRSIDFLLVKDDYLKISEVSVDALVQVFSDFNLAYISQRDVSFTEGAAEFSIKARAIIIFASSSTNSYYAIRQLALVCDYYKERIKTGLGTFIDGNLYNCAVISLKRRINSLAREGELIDCKFLADYLRIWADIENVSTIRGWVIGVICLPDNIIKLLKAFEFMTAHNNDTVVSVEILKKVGCIDDILDEINNSNLSHPLVGKFMKAIA